MKKQILGIIILIVILLGLFIKKINFENDELRILKKSERIMEREKVKKFIIPRVYNPNLERIDQGIDIRELSENKLKDLSYLVKIFPELTKDFYVSKTNESGYYESFPMKEYFIKDSQLKYKYYLAYNKKVIGDMYLRKDFNVIDIMIFRIDEEVKYSNEEGSENNNNLNIKAHVEVMANYRGILREDKKSVNFYEVSDEKKISLLYVDNDIIINNGNDKSYISVDGEIIKSDIPYNGRPFDLFARNIKESKTEYRTDKYTLYTDLKNTHDKLDLEFLIKYNGPRDEKEIFIKYFLKVGYNKN